jgi:hypothetical protein
MTYHLINDNHGVQAVLFTQTGAANPAGSGNGASVTIPIAVADKYGNGRLPASLHYNVAVSPSQPCFVTITGKTSTGFNVVLSPKDASTTLVAGTFDVSVLA